MSAVQSAASALSSSFGSNLSVPAATAAAAAYFPGLSSSSINLPTVPAVTAAAAASPSFFGDDPLNYVKLEEPVSYSTTAAAPSLSSRGVVSSPGASVYEKRLDRLRMKYGSEHSVDMLLELERLEKAYRTDSREVEKQYNRVKARLDRAWKLIPKSQVETANESGDLIRKLAGLRRKADALYRKRYEKCEEENFGSTCADREDLQKLQEDSMQYTEQIESTVEDARPMVKSWLKLLLKSIAAGGVLFAASQNVSTFRKQNGKKSKIVYEYTDVADRLRTLRSDLRRVSNSVKTSQRQQHELQKKIGDLEKVEPNVKKCVTENKVFEAGTGCIERYPRCGTGKVPYNHECTEKKRALRQIGGVSKWPCKKNNVYFDGIGCVPDCGPDASRIYDRETGTCVTRTYPDCPPGQFPMNGSCWPNSKYLRDHGKTVPSCREGEEINERTGRCVSVNHPTHTTKISHAFLKTAIRRILENHELLKGPRLNGKTASLQAWYNKHKHLEYA